jgi:sugar phosphate permease
MTDKSSAFQSADPGSKPAPMKTSASPRVRRIQRTALALLVLSGIVNYIDRASLAVGNQLIRHDLGLSIAQMGFLLSAFLVAYAFAQLPTGAMIDRAGPRLLLTLGLALWSVAQGVGGMVTSFSQFIGARVLLGVGEAPQFPTGARVVRDWFNQRDRGLATGVFNCSSTLGNAIGVPLLTTLMLAFGWRWMFLIMSLVGLLVALLWFLAYRSPAAVTLTPDESAYLTEGDPSQPQSSLTFAAWQQLFRIRSTWGMIFGNFGCVYVVWIFATWLPAYLETERHMSIRSTGFVSAIPFLCGTLGALLGGFLVDGLVRRGMKPMASRKVPAALCLFATAACTAAAAYANSNTLTVILISASVFLLYIATTCGWALASVGFPANCTASIGAVLNFGGYLGGALAPALTGLIVQSTGSFVLALVVGAVISMASGIAYLVLVREVESSGDPQSTGASTPPIRASKET